MSTFPLYQFGLNRKVIGKCDADKLSYSGAFKSAKGTLQDLAAHISKGHPWMPAILDGNRKRWQGNANYAEVIAADIDSGMTIQDALKHPFISAYCGLGIESSSSKIYCPEKNPDSLEKFRLVFALPKPAEGHKTIRILNRYLIQLLGTADPACKDANRFFFGAKDRTPFLLKPDVSLPENFIDAAIAWDRDEEERQQAEYEAALAYRRSLGYDTPQDNLEMVEAALAVGAPIRSPGCGNYSECVSIAAGLLNEFGEATAIALLERYIPPHTPSNDKWNPEQVVRGLRRGSVSRPATLGVIFHICKQNGFRFPERQVEKKHLSLEPDRAEYQAFVAEQKEQELIEEVESRESTLTRVLSLFKKGLSKRERQRREAIQQHWNVGAIEYKKGDRWAVWSKAINQNRKFILDQSGTGTGKSHDAGMFQTSWNHEIERVIYLSPEHRNPTTTTLAEWADMPARHAGLTVIDGKTRRATPEHEAIEAGNCGRTAAVGVLRSKGVHGADTDLVCQYCPMLNACKHFSGNGYGFKHQRKLALSQERLRSHLLSAPDPSEFDYSKTLLMCDEAGESFITETRQHVQGNDIRETIAALAIADSLADLKPLLLETLNILDEPSGRYGLTHQAIVERLKSLLPATINYEAIYEATKPDLGALEPPQEIDFEQTDLEAGEALKALEARYQSEKAELKRMKELASISAQTALKGFKPDIRKEFSERSKALTAEYKRERSKLQSQKRDELKQIRRSLTRATAQHANEAAELLKTKVIKQWLCDFLAGLEGKERRFFSIKCGELAIATPDTRHRDVFKAAKATIFLDATLTREDLALKLGVSPDEIFVCRQKETPTHNLKLIQVSDLGRMGMSRGADQSRRLAAIVSHYQQTDPLTQVIDFKRFEADGAWWRDSRGVNDFLDCTTLILAGTPCRNLNDLLAEYALLTGDFDMESDGFKAFVDRRIAADIQQGIGRLRANIRPNEQLTVVLVSDFALDLPNIQHLRAVDICPDAGSKFERFAESVKAAIAQLKAAGEKITQSAVSLISGYSQQYLSRHWKLLQTLLEGSNSKSSKNSAPQELVELVEAIAIGCESSELVRSLESDLYSWIPDNLWSAIVRQLSQTAKDALINALILTLPAAVLEEVIPA